MEYSLRADGNRVVLDVIACADKSLIGLTLGDSTFMSISVDELYSIIKKVSGEREFNLLTRKLIDNGLVSEAKKEIIIMETAGSCAENQCLRHHILQLLRLYKPFDIYSCYMTCYRYDGKDLKYGGNIKIAKHEHASYNFYMKSYNLTKEEFEEFPRWVRAHYVFGEQRNNNRLFLQIIQLYDEAFLVGFTELEFIMLFTILEMIFGSGRTENTYQISRGTALILSKTKNEMQAVYTSMKKLYSIRSQYVHKGKTIKREDLDELRNYVRLVILKLIEFEYYNADRSFEELIEKITFTGYGMFVL